MCGHDHCIGHIDEGLGPQYVVAGAGFMCCYEQTNCSQRMCSPEGSVKFHTAGAGGSELFPMPFEQLSGFTSFRVKDESMEVAYHAHNGTILYTTPPIPPRTAEMRARANATLA